MIQFDSATATPPGYDAFCIPRRASQASRDPLRFRSAVSTGLAASIANGVSPWRRSWSAGAAPRRPFNPVSGQTFKGANALWLDIQGYSDPRWLTAEQGHKLGGALRSGQRATIIESRNQIVRNRRVGRGLPVRQFGYVRVFNAAQFVGLPAREPTPNSNVITMLPTDMPIASYRESYRFFHMAAHEHRDCFDTVDIDPAMTDRLSDEIIGFSLARDRGAAWHPPHARATNTDWICALLHDEQCIFRVANDADVLQRWILAETGEDAYHQLFEATK